MHIEDLTRVYNMLEDNSSKATYSNRISYLMNGERKYIREMVNRNCPELLPITDDVWDEVFSGIKKDKGVFLYGAGERAKLNEQIWRRYLDDCILGFLGGDVSKQGKIFCGTTVYAPDEIDNHLDTSIIVYTSRYQDQVVESLLAKGIDRRRIYTVPDASKISKNQYFDKDIIELQDEQEVFLDVGCFDLGTTIELKKRCNTKHVYAFEPDRYNYDRVTHIKKELEYDDVTLLPYGASDSECMISFAATGESYSRAATNGVFEETDVIEVKKIDQIIPQNETVTFIKMDIEGMELDALRGAADTIRRCRPKLAIAIYHKAEDLTEIPLFIKRLVPDYKLYIRHYSNELVETVLYAI